MQRAGGVLSGLSGTHWRPLSGGMGLSVGFPGAADFGVAAPDFKAPGIGALISHAVRDSR